MTRDNLFPDSHHPVMIVFVENQVAERNVVCGLSVLSKHELALEILLTDLYVNSDWIQQ